MPKTITVPDKAGKYALLTVIAVVLIGGTARYGPHVIHPEKHTGPMVLKLVEQKTWACGKTVPDHELELLQKANLSDRERIDSLARLVQEKDGSETCSSRKQYWMRPNNEVVVMEWDGTMPAFAQGLAVKDITYTDDSKDVRHFVKASF